MERTVFQNACVIGYTGRRDLEVAQGRIARISPHRGEGAGIDLDGRVISPRFVDSHLHLDKAMVACDEEPAGLLAAIRRSVGYLEGVPVQRLEEDMTRRSEAVIEMALRAGTGCMKTNLMVGGRLGWASLDSLNGLRRRFRGRMRLLAAQVHKLAGERRLAEVFRMITENPAANCLLEDYPLREGRVADFVVLDARSPAQAVLRGGGVLLRYEAGEPVREGPPISL